MPRVQVEVPQTENSTPVVADPEDAQSDIGQYFYKDFEIERLRKDPEYLLKYRKQIEYGINKACAAMVYKNSEASRMTEMYMRAEMTRRLDNHPVLTKKLIPSWSVGCRFATLPVSSCDRPGANCLPPQTAYSRGWLPRSSYPARRRARLL